MTVWEPDIQDFSKITKEKMSFIIQECKLNLQATFDSAKELDNKSIIVIGLLITLVSGLVGFVFSQYKPDIAMDKQNLPLLIAIGFLVFNYTMSCVSLIDAILPAGYKPPGNSPENLLNTNMCDQDFRFMLYCEIQSYSVRIKQNNERNSEKSDKFQATLKAVIQSPLKAVFIFFFVTLLIGLLKLL